MNWGRVTQEAVRLLQKRTDPSRNRSISEVRQERTHGQTAEEREQTPEPEP